MSIVTNAKGKVHSSANMQQQHKYVKENKYLVINFKNQMVTHARTIVAVSKFLNFNDFLGTEDSYLAKPHSSV